MPIVAEESEAASYAGFSRAPASWFVDPLDGTRDFVARNGEFAVMIGLAGVKGARVACGEADLYFGAGNAGMLWDSCAPEAIVRAAGGEWRTAFGERYAYAREQIVNERGIVAGNDALVTQLVAARSV